MIKRNSVKAHGTDNLNHSPSSGQSKNKNFLPSDLGLVAVLMLPPDIVRISIDLPVRVIDNDFDPRLRYRLPVWGLLSDVRCHRSGNCSLKTADIS